MITPRIQPKHPKGIRVVHKIGKEYSPKGMIYPGYEDKIIVDFDEKIVLIQKDDTNSSTEGNS